MSIYKTYHLNDYREELKKLKKPIEDKDFSVETMLDSTIGLVLDGRAFHSFAPVTVGTTNTAILIFKAVDTETWLLKNKEAMASVQRGLAESAGGKTVDLGSFAPVVKKSRKKKPNA